VRVRQRTSAVTEQSLRYRGGTGEYVETKGGAPRTERPNCLSMEREGDPRDSKEKSQGGHRQDLRGRKNASSLHKKRGKTRDRKDLRGNGVL